MCITEYGVIYCLENALNRLMHALKGKQDKWKVSIFLRLVSLLRHIKKTHRPDTTYHIKTWNVARILESAKITTFFYQSLRRTTYHPKCLLLQYITSAKLCLILL